MWMALLEELELRFVCCCRRQEHKSECGDGSDRSGLVACGAPALEGTGRDVLRVGERRKGLENAAHVGGECYWERERRDILFGGSRSECFTIFSERKRIEMRLV